MKLPTVDQQGDGVKSFVGCLLAIVMEKLITLLDEPEAFLHPPQARLLGSLLAKEHINNQLILATHSGDILRGILDSNPTNLNILRITRKDNKNYAFKLNASELKKFWSDPILRFSNILDGLFHETVVICESDTDCRFYSAIMTSLYDGSNGKEPRQQPDFFFTASGGKNRIPTIVRSLVKIKLPTRVIVDFDLLFDKDKTQELFELLGGTWNSVNSNYEIVKDAIDNQSTHISASQLCIEVEKVLSKIKMEDKNKEVSEDFKLDIRKILNASSFRSKAKVEGMNILNKQEKSAFDKLIVEFKKVGLWLVPCGELESFDKSVSGHSTNWVAKVFEKNISVSPDLKEAREFISELAKFKN